MHKLTKRLPSAALFFILILANSAVSASDVFVSMGSIREDWKRVNTILIELAQSVGGNKPWVRTVEKAAPSNAAPIDFQPLERAALMAEIDRFANTLDDALFAEGISMRFASPTPALDPTDIQELSSRTRSVRLGLIKLVESTEPTLDAWRLVQPASLPVADWRDAYQQVVYARHRLVVFMENARPNPQPQS